MRWIAFLSGVLLLAAPVHAASVLSVGDGDTITVREGSQRIKVRLACIDAPEISQTPYGMESRGALQGLLPIGSEVTLKTKAVDRYGRSVAEVLNGATNINQQQVASGNAFVYWQYISGCDRQTYSRLENDARLKRAGVWSVTGGIERPWDYRHNKQRHHTGTAPAVSNGTRTSTGRYYCKDLTYQKAQDLLKQGHTYLDRDGDGEACESRNEHQHRMARPVRSLASLPDQAESSGCLSSCSASCRVNKKAPSPGG